MGNFLQGSMDRGLDALTTCTKGLENERDLTTVRKMAGNSQ